MSKENELEFLEAHKHGTGYETNFAVKKFLELPSAKQEALHAKIMSDDKQKRAEAAETLLDFILKNLSEMGKFVHEGIDTWLIWPNDHEPKAIYLLLYFRHHLQKNPDGTFSISPIEL